MDNGSLNNQRGVVMTSDGSIKDKGGRLLIDNKSVRGV